MLGRVGAGQLPEQLGAEAAYRDRGFEPAPPAAVQAGRRQAPGQVHPVGQSQAFHPGAVPVLAAQLAVAVDGERAALDPVGGPAVVGEQLAGQRRAVGGVDAARRRRYSPMSCRIAATVSSSSSIGQPRSAAIVPARCRQRRLCRSIRAARLPGYLAQQHQRRPTRRGTGQRVEPVELRQHRHHPRVVRQRGPALLPAVPPLSERLRLPDDSQTVRCVPLRLLTGVVQSWALSRVCIPLRSRL
jgi:hypothetical protein